MGFLDENAYASVKVLARLYEFLKNGKIVLTFNISTYIIYVLILVSNDEYYITYHTYE